VYRRKEQGLMNLFRACKKIKATYKRKNDYQEQFILMRKRALSEKYAHCHEINKSTQLYVEDLKQN
jgi:hypothetical protein